jgi:hypothetical protein
MQAGFCFPQQFFAVSSVLPDHRVLLAGGLYPLGGPRSAYRASVACYDYRAAKVIWLHETPKSYPFRAIAHTHGVCGAMLDQNFVRCPTGLFRFDLETGEPVLPDCKVGGWKIQFVDATAETFLFSWVFEEISRTRMLSERDATFQERSFPYHSTSGGKNIERVIPAGKETFVAVFSLVEGRRVVYSVEQWSLDGAAPRWERRTMLRDAVRNDPVLLLWDCMGRTRTLEILSLESGQLQTSFRLPVADVVSIHPIDAHCYALLAISGVYLLNTLSQTLSPLPGMGPDAFLDFGSLAVDSASGQLIIVTAGNHQRPGTRLTVLDF